MTLSSDSSKRDYGALINENEQLHTSLESALEENALLVEDRDRLRDRVRDLSRELATSDATISRQEERANWIEPAFLAQSGTEEELRVAFEELQVLTEELETANSSLNQTNRQLDMRVEQRTRQLKEINDALRATEASLRAVADLVPELLWRADSGGRADWFNQRWLQYTGRDNATLTGMGWLDAIHPCERIVARDAWGAAVNRGQAFEHEHRIRDASGEYRWFLVRAEPLRDERDRIVHWFAAGTDIDEQRRTIEALQRSETRFRTLVEGMPQLVWRAKERGDWTWSSPQWGDYTAQTDDQASGMGWLEAFHPDCRDAAAKAWAHADAGGSLEIEGLIFQASESRYRHFRTRALPVRDASDRIVEWLGTSTDVDDILQLQEQQAVLVRELQHRTRNLMAVVQAVIQRTLRSVSTFEQFETSINDRLSALARVQGLLSRRETGTRIPFDMLLREELSAHIDLSDQGPDPKVRLEGPANIPLRSSIVQTFALALHELATNAVKYGGLSHHEGRLKVVWGVRHDHGHAPRLWVDWRETRVSIMPEAGDGSRGSGYGRELIEKALPYQLGARTTYMFEPDGVHCTIEVTVPAEHLVLEKVDG